LRQKGNVPNLEEDVEIELIHKNTVITKDSIEINVNPDELFQLEQNRNVKIAQNQNYTQNFTRSDSDCND
jgi:hypothetical protein